MFLKWKGAFESWEFKVNRGKTKQIMSVSKGKIFIIDPCAKCEERVTEKLLLSTKRNECVHGICEKLNPVSATQAKNLLM